MSGTKAVERAQAKAQAKAEYNAFLAVCPSRQLLDRISDKWVVLVLCALGSDAAGSALGSDAAGSALGSDAAGSALGSDAVGRKVMRYSELARQLVGVSQKMLTQTLRALERDGLLTRTVVPTVPVTVSYELTALGQSLHAVAQGLRSWAQENMGEVLEQRRNYDAGAEQNPRPVPAPAGVVNGPSKTR